MREGSVVGRGGEQAGEALGAGIQAGREQHAEQQGGAARRVSCWWERQQVG